jgi:hypothetical protein
VVLSSGPFVQVRQYGQPGLEEPVGRQGATAVKFWALVRCADGDPVRASFSQAWLIAKALWMVRTDAGSVVGGTFVALAGDICAS